MMGFVTVVNKAEKWHSEFWNIFSKDFVIYWQVAV